jgi:tetratricopeptide (TPR) repeat protein
MRQPVDAKNGPKPLFWPFQSFPAGAAACFLLSYAYVWLRLEPSVQYRCSGVPFFLSRSFFGEFLGFPGGLLDYAAAFLAQLNYYDWLGGLVFMALGCLLFLGARAVCSRLSGVAPLTGGFMPVFLLLCLWGLHDGQAPAAGLGVALGLGLAIGYLRLPWQRIWLRSAACWALSVLAAGLAGLWPCLLFLTLCCGYEFKVRRAWKLRLGCLLPAVAVPLAMLGLAGLPATRILNPWATGAPLWLIAALFLCVPLTALVLALLPKPAPAPKETARARHKAAAPVPLGRRLQRPVVKRALAAGLFLGGWAAVWFGHGGPQRAFARIEYYAGRKEFDKVLAVAAPLPVLNRASEVRLQLALYHAGRLSEDLFANTNQTAWQLLPGLRLGLGACRAQCDTLLELGQVNEAEHLAHEALEIEGNRPDLLRLLAQINILKNRPRAARVFLNLLAQAPFQRAGAAACLRDLDRDPRLSDDQALALIRSRMVTTDLAYDGLPAESFFQQLLQSNPRNQMAFEYLLAQYLVTRDLDRLIKQLGRLDDFGYRAIPRHLEEAVLLYQQLKGIPVDLHGRQIRPETVQRFRGFSEALNRARENPEDRPALARNFGDTFWFYFYTRPKAGPQSVLPAAQRGHT